MTGQHVQLVEGARVEEELDALASEHLALGVLTLDGSLGAGVQRLFFALLELLDALAHGVFRHSGHSTGRPPGGPNAAR